MVNPPRPAVRPTTPPAPPTTSAKPSTRAIDPATADNDDDPYSAELKVGRNKPAGRRRPTTAATPVTTTAERARTTSTTLPLPLLDQLHRTRLSNEMAGTKFKVQQRLNDAILELPTDPQEILAALQRYRSRLNFGVGTDEVGFIEEGRFTFRVAQNAERHLAAIMIGLYDHLGRRVHRQDLFGLAMIRCIAK